VPLQAHIERGQKWEEDKKKKLEIRLNQIKRTGSSPSFSRESSAPQSLAKTPLMLQPEQLSSSEFKVRRWIELVKECEGFVLEGGQCRSELTSPRVASFPSFSVLLSRE